MPTINNSIGNIGNLNMSMNKNFKQEELKRKITIDHLDDSKIIGIIDTLAPQTFGNTTVVFAQSHTDGSLVMKGTEVDLVLVPRKKINFGVFKGAHLGLAEKSIVELLGLMNDEEFKGVMTKYEEFKQVTDDDKLVLDEALARHQLSFTFDNSQVDQSVDAFVKTLVNAKPFYEVG